MSNKFVNGDRVILVGKELIPTKDWPVWGSEYSCVGTINGIGNGYSYIYWDNGRKRTIDDSYLRHFTGREEDSLSPNVAFLKYKRGINEKRKERRQSNINKS